MSLRHRPDAAVGNAEGALPPHPYRDVAILHIVLAGILLGVAWLASAGAARAIVIAGVYAAAAIAWSWLRVRRSIRPAAGRRS